MKDNIIKFLKFYFVFMLCALLISLSMEMLIPTPEVKQALGIIMFYTIFNFVGCIIFLLKTYKPMKMGVLSLIIGFVLEFALMKPEWVQKIYIFKIDGDVIGALIVTSIYWLIAWGIPSYIIHKYLNKNKAL